MFAGADGGVRKLWDLNLSISRYLKLSSWHRGCELKYLKVSQATELLSQAMGLEFEYLKVSQAMRMVCPATGLELKYLKVSQATGLGIGVSQGISSYGATVSSSGA